MINRLKPIRTRANDLFLRSAICILSLFIPCSLISKEPPNIPSTIHWIRLDSSPISKGEIESIRSWQKLHPKWRFKLWSNGSCSMRHLELCPIDSSTQTLENLQKTILQKEGGIVIDLQLTCCKPLSFLVKRGEPFQTLDGRSIIGCRPGQYDAPRKILPPSFIYPDQVFATEIFTDPLIGVCFPRFRILEGLTEEFRKIHAAPYEAKIKADALSERLSKIKYSIGIIFLLSLLNASLLILSFPLLKAIFTRKKTLVILLVCASLALSFIPLSIRSKKKARMNQKVATKEKPVDPRNFSSLCSLDRYPHSLPSSDLENLKIYNRFFTQRFLPNESNKEKKIPQVIHVIWGGCPFPQSSIANLASWMKHHPDWIFMFWTDDPRRPVPLEGMKKRLFEEILSQSSIRPYFEQSRNWGEKSDLLRYEILFREGGVYIDHDIECLHPFTSLHERTSFYASTEPLHESPIHDSHLTVSNCIIGVAPQHPILSHALALCIEKWGLVSHMFPFHDQRSALLRTLYWTFSSFDEAVRLHLSSGDTDSIILPSTLIFLRHFSSAYYGPLESTNYPLANHQWANTWFERTPSIQYFPSAESLTHDISHLSKFCKRMIHCLAGSLLFLIILLLYRGLCSKLSYFRSFFSNRLQATQVQKT